MIFDEYTTRLRALPMPPDSGADRRLRDQETAAIIDGAIAEVDRLSRVIERDVTVRTRLQSLGDVAQAAGVRVSIEFHRRPSEPAPRG